MASDLMVYLSHEESCESNACQWMEGMMLELDMCLHNDNACWKVERMIAKYHDLHLYFCRALSHVTSWGTHSTYSTHYIPGVFGHYYRPCLHQCVRCPSPSTNPHPADPTGVLGNNPSPSWFDGHRCQCLKSPTSPRWIRRRLAPRR